MKELAKDCEGVACKVEGESRQWCVFDEILKSVLNINGVPIKLKITERWPLTLTM